MDGPAARTQRAETRTVLLIVWGVTVATYLLVSLREPELDVASYLSRAASQRPAELWRGLRRAARGGRGKTLAAIDLERARMRADRAHARLARTLVTREGVLGRRFG